MQLFRRHRRVGSGAPESADRPAPPAPHLLLCDDNVTVTKVVAQMFVNAGWTVDVTDTGRECLRAIERRVPDVIVLDQRFYYGLNGLETAELARKSGFDRPIVLFSAHLDDAARERADRLNLLPVSKVDMTAVVRHVTAAHRDHTRHRTGPGSAAGRRSRVLGQLGAEGLEGLNR